MALGIIIPPQAPTPIPPPVHVVPPKITFTQIVAPPPDGKAKDARIAGIETKIGKPIRVIRQALEDLVVVLREGVIVDLHISKGWSGRSTLRPEELGLEGKAAKMAMERLALGRKRLMPRDLDVRFGAVITDIRQHKLYLLTIKTPYGRFLPSNKWDVLLPQLEAARVKFMALVEELIANLDQVKEQIRTDFVPLAEEAWKAYRAAWTEGDTLPAGTFAAQDDPTPLFVGEFVERIVAEVPTAEQIRMAVKFEYELTAYGAADPALADTHATGNADLNTTLREHLVERQRRYIDDFLTSVRDEIAERMKDVLDEFGDKLSARKHAARATLDALLRRVADLRELNLVNDEEIDKTLQGFAATIEARKAQGKVAAADVKVALERAVGLVAAAAKADLHPSGFENLD